VAGGENQVRMEFSSAEEQKVFLAEKRISIFRALIIVFGTLTFFFLDNPFIHKKLAYALMAVTWPYGAYVLYFKPYEKYPVFMAGWFTWLGDGLFTTLWIYATGGFYSPYHVIYYTSVIAVAFRFGLKTTLFTSALYTACYAGLLAWMGQLEGNGAIVAVRMGFTFFVGALTYQITRETLLQAKQKFIMKGLMLEAQQNHRKLAENQARLNQLNRELQLHNNLLHHAEENARIGSFALYITTNVFEYSENLFRLLGHEPGEFTPSLDRYLSCVHPADRETLKREVQEATQKNRTDFTPHRVITNRGDTLFFRSSARMIGEDDHQILIGTVQDVTDDVMRNEELRQKNLELERTNLELSSFNYISSHDLQEPVRKIITFSELISERLSSNLGEPLLGHLSRIHAAARRLQHLISAFLAYSEITTSHMSEAEVDLDALLAEVSGGLVKEHKFKLSHGKLPKVNGDRFQLSQLFYHLIGNAIKYCKPGECPDVEVEALEVDGSDLQHPGAVAGQRYWKISISDKGIGFDQQYAERIFGLFQRLHSKESYGGTGIGLAICKKVAHNHNGFIEARGLPDRGATFVIYLPAK
jgi:signal transduction histidine kinase